MVIKEIMFSNLLNVDLPIMLYNSILTMLPYSICKKKKKIKLFQIMFWQQTKIPSEYFKSVIK